MDLDAILLDAARAAGADVQPGVRLVELLRDGERVVGAVLDQRGERREVRASLVVGADGPHSTVAKLAGAKEYYAYDSPRCVYWAYWPRLADYSTRAPYRGATAILHQGRSLYTVFPANRDQLLVGLAFPVEDLPEWRGRQKEVLLEKLRAFPFTAPLVADDPLSKVRGVVNARFFFREAVGPGWALVGDAGLFKDPTPGLGISDALRDSRALSQAILDGSARALQRYWRKRDIDSLGLFEFARDTGTPGYDNALTRLLFNKLQRDPSLHARVLDVMSRRIEPSQVFSAGQVTRWALAALCQGRFGVLKPFFASGEKNAHFQRELAVRRELLARV